MKKAKDGKRKSVRVTMSLDKGTMDALELLIDSGVGDSASGVVRAVVREAARRAERREEMVVREHDRRPPSG